MKKSIFICVFATLVTVLALTSCSSDDEKDKTVEPQISVSTSEITLDDNNKGNVVVTSNTSWTVSSNETWLSCSPSEGINTQTITISAADNPNKTNRKAVLTIKDISGKKGVTVNVTQKAVLDALDVVPDLMVTFTDGMATNFNFGKNVEKWNYTVYHTTTSKTDEEIVDELSKQSSVSKSTYVFKATNTSTISWFAPNEEYYLCSLGFDASGKYGKLTKTRFKTRAEKLPLAEITNVKASTSNGKACWSVKVSFKNGAVGSYTAASNSLELYQTDDHFLAYDVYRQILENKLQKSSYTDGTYERTGQQVVVCSWGVDSSGNIGDYFVARSGSPSSVPAKSLKGIVAYSDDYCLEVLKEVSSHVECSTFLPNKAVNSR